MSKMIQVRNVPDRVHRELVRRAKRRGQTLTQYVAALIERDLTRPPLEELLAEIESQEPVHMPVSAAELVRQSRAEHSAALDERMDRVLHHKGSARRSA